MVRQVPESAFRPQKAPLSWAVAMKRMEYNVKINFS